MSHGAPATEKTGVIENMFFCMEQPDYEARALTSAQVHTLRKRPVNSAVISTPLCDNVEPMNWKISSLIALVVLVPCLAYLYLSHALFGTGPVTIAIQVLAISLVVWARFTFGIRSFHAAANPTAGGLVTSGPYKYIRHPIYAAILFFVWTGISAHPSLIAVTVGLVASSTTVLRMVAEEKLLVPTYPEYAEYARTTKRVVPFLF